MNKLKNEVLFQVGDITRTLRPTFECLIEIEDQLLRAGRYKTLIEFINSIGSQQAALKETVIVIREASKAGGKEITQTEIIDLFEEYGMVPLQMALANFLSKALYGGPQLDAERKSDAKKK